MKKISYFTIILILLACYSCSKLNKKESATIIAPENVMNVAAAKKAKAEITGEQSGVSIANEKINVWNIVYRDDKGNLHSTIIKKIPEDKSKVGDSLSIYYDETNPMSLPIHESQYDEMNK